jgi:hypothetical protein
VDPSEIELPTVPEPELAADVVVTLRAMFSSIIDELPLECLLLLREKCCSAGANPAANREIIARIDLRLAKFKVLPFDAN